MPIELIRGLFNKPQEREEKKKKKS